MYVTPYVDIILGTVLLRALVVAFYYVVLALFNVIYYTFALLFRVMPFVLIIAFVWFLLFKLN
jgi:hypothetical protein